MMNSIMKPTVDCRRSRDCLAEIVTVPVTTGGPGKCIKGWPFVHIPSLQPRRILSSPNPSFNRHPLSWTWAVASDCNGARRPQGGVDFGGRQPCTLCCIPRPPSDPPLSLSSMVVERSVAGVDTNAYFSTQISSSRLRPRRLTWADGRTLPMRQLLVCTQESRSHG